MSDKRIRTENDRARCREWRVANKERVSAYNKAYAAQHREGIKERMANWRSANPELIKEATKKWRANHIERVHETSRRRNKRYYSLHPERVKAANDKWKAEHPEIIKENSRRRQIEHPEKHRDFEHNRRAKKRGAQAEKIIDIGIFERDGWRCQLCRKKVNKNLKYPNPLSPSLDHIIPLSRGGSHIRANVQLAHLQCNVAMGTGGIKQPRLF